MVALAVFMFHSTAFTDNITLVDSRASPTLGHRLRQLREDRQLSLRALERRCGVAAGRLSRIENGHIDPRVSTVQAILDGLEASLEDLSPPLQERATDAPLVVGNEEPDSMIVRVLRERGTIRDLAEAHGAHNPRLFGSIARGTAGLDSDVDLLVDLEPGRTLFDLAALRAELERLLGASVDVVPAAGLEGDARDEILADTLAL